MDRSSPPPPRSQLVGKARRFRFLATILSWLDRFLSWPRPPRPSFQVTFPTRISKSPGEIELYFFTGPSKPSSAERNAHRLNRRPVLINFHGGGFSIGHALDDARWAGAVLDAYPEVVVVSVNYRLAPEHPYPVAIEDSADAVLWLWDHSEQYHLDRDRFALSGASSGGNLALTVPLKLYEELTRQQRLDTKEDIRLAGLVAFYPTVDWTRTRQQRDATNPIAPQKSMIPPSVFNFFDDSYLLPETLPVKTETQELDFSHPYLSPGLAPAQLLLSAYPVNVSIYTCGWDQLLVEGNTFRHRLRRIFSENDVFHIGGLVIEDAIHGFDKKPSFCMGNATRDRMYGDAAQQLEFMWRYY
ncbi:uncharacterized protein N7459_001290 [Penicillium hispanicum]|uniref:uncharacterized protein n=1 Tax=Penicillium hispanicum TaxID=1080232 RepID=UPI0025422413|nr:uncharacterized protein N7459_001290 [Penicillium hispanicum]KAJ5595082.1 hypothetical protein N7459_001290 [Penicillium hispanicum]